MISDAPGIRAIAERLQSAEFSDAEAALCIAIGLALTALAWAILSPKGDK
jgi:hypothetical protein